jgi:hypothetical protein
MPRTFVRACRFAIGLHIVSLVFEFIMICLSLTHVVNIYKAGGSSDRFARTISLVVLSILLTILSAYLVDVVCMASLPVLVASTCKFWSLVAVLLVLVAKPHCPNSCALPACTNA